MPLESYDQLIESVVDWLGKDDLAAQAVDFVRLAELDIQRELRIQPVEKEASGTLTAAQDYLTQPSDFLEPSYFRLDVTPPHAVGPVDFDGLAAIRGQGNGQPTAFKPHGTKLLLAPTPDSNYAYTLFYLGGMTRLSNTNQTNWLLANGADALLFGALTMAHAYLGADDRIATWSSVYQTQREKLRLAAWRQKVGSSPLRSRPVWVV